LIVYRLVWCTLIRRVLYLQVLWSKEGTWR
jgi:hypothetical protein